MFALSQLVDIPHLFRRLDALPRELATARQELWAANVEVGDAEWEYENARSQTLEERAKEHPGTIPVGPPLPNAAMKKALDYLLTRQEEQTVHEADLADLNDEMSALRPKVDLITALTMGCQETSKSVLLRQLLRAVRSTPGPVEEPALEAGSAPEDLRAGDPFPF